MESLQALFWNLLSMSVVAALLRVKLSWGIVGAASVAIASAQVPDPPLSNLNVGAHDPLYTTYAAPLSRSEYLVDEGYFLNYFSPSQGVTYTTDTAGTFALGWRLGKLTTFETRDFDKPPV